MHGGAKGSGGPTGARNGNYKHGRYPAETRATRKWIHESIREMRAITNKVRELTRARRRLASRLLDLEKPKREPCYRYVLPKG
jgi:hypothetical protein